MPVSISAILLSGTAALFATGVAAGFGNGVGVGLGPPVCGRVWLMTAKANMAVKIDAAKIGLFITSPGSCSWICIHRLHRLCREGKTSGKIGKYSWSDYCTYPPPAGAVVTI